MRKKGLVYRMTMILGLTIVVGQFGGELAYQKFFKKDREIDIQAEKELEERKSRFSEEDKLNEDINNDIEGSKKKRSGLISSWSESRQKRLDKIKQSKERPSAPLLEELQEKPGYKEIKTRKLVERDPEYQTQNSKDAARDDYI
eukprot:403352045